ADPPVDSLLLGIQLLEAGSAVDVGASYEPAVVQPAEGKGVPRERDGSQSSNHNAKPRSSLHWGILPADGSGRTSLIVLRMPVLGTATASLAAYPTLITLDPGALS